MLTMYCLLHDVEDRNDLIGMFHFYRVLLGRLDLREFFF